MDSWFWDTERERERDKKTIQLPAGSQWCILNHQMFGSVKLDEEANQKLVFLIRLGERMIERESSSKTPTAAKQTEINRH